MSISGDIAIKILRLVHPGKGSFKEIEKLKKRAEKENARAKFSVPKDKRANYELVKDTEYPCLIIRSRKNKCHDDSKAVMFIYGGITNCWKIQLEFAVDYANRTGVDVWYPLYPSASEVNITRSINVLYQVYCKMTEKYDHKKIAVVGLSLGGSLAMAIIDSVNRKKAAIGMPGLVIAHSPGGIPDNDDDWAELTKYEKSDPFFAVSDLKAIEELISHGEEVPSYAITPRYGDFHHTPPTYIYYGEEVLAGNAAGYKDAFERAGEGDKLHIDIQKNMIHCYSCSPVFPESKKTYFETIELITKL